MGRHVKRASRQKIAWFRKRLGPPIGERMRAGYTVCVQDEAVCVADARLRKGVYTPKGVRGVYTYTGSHSKTVVFGLITLDGEGFFQRYGSFTGKEFAGFLKAACERFGEVLMITGGAPQHRSKFVREEIGSLDGVELQFLPPGCPDLNAIEEVWRQMKHAVLDVPYTDSNMFEIGPAKTRWIPSPYQLHEKRRTVTAVPGREGSKRQAG